MGLFERLRRLGADRCGNIAMLTGASIWVIAMGAGYGLNTAQLFQAKSALQNALDAAVASTARDLTTGTIAEDEARGSIEAFLDAHAAAKPGREGKFVLENVVVDRAAKTVDATARIDVHLAFPIVGGDPVRGVGARTGAIYSDRRIEVAMMLDVTGSMAGSRIGDLKTAASNAVDALLAGQNPREPRVRVSIVPYANAVNVGPLARTTVFQERAGRPDLPPFEGASPHQVAADTGSFGDTCATERKLPDGSADLTDVGPDAIRTYEDGSGRSYRARVNRDDRLRSSECPRAPLVPLTADAAALKRSIAAFSADGHTAGAIGIQWTRYMLSQNWRAAIVGARLGDGPADLDGAKVRKVAILMTDGEFNTVYAGVGHGQNHKGQSRLAGRNAEAICVSMKADGIEIFTIGFQLNRTARAVLQSCASPDEGSVRHHFEASTGAELDAAFQEIISQTERLFLSM